MNEPPSTPWFRNYVRQKIAGELALGLDVAAEEKQETKKEETVEPVKDITSAESGERKEPTAAARKEAVGDFFERWHRRRHDATSLQEQEEPIPELLKLPEEKGNQEGDDRRGKRSIARRVLDPTDMLEEQGLLIQLEEQTEQQGQAVAAPPNANEPPATDSVESPIVAADNPVEEVEERTPPQGEESSAMTEESNVSPLQAAAEGGELGPAALVRLRSNIDELENDTKIKALELLHRMKLVGQAQRDIETLLDNPVEVEDDAGRLEESLQERGIQETPEKMESRLKPEEESKEEPQEEPEEKGEKEKGQAREPEPKQA